MQSDKKKKINKVVVRAIKICNVSVNFKKHIKYNNAFTYNFKFIQNN